MFPSRKPRSCTEKRVFLHVVKGGIPKWTLSGEFFKNTEVLKKYGIFKNTRFLKMDGVFENRSFLKKDGVLKTGVFDEKAGLF